MRERERERESKYRANYGYFGGIRGEFVKYFRFGLGGAYIQYTAFVQKKTPTSWYLWMQAPGAMPPYMQEMGDRCTGFYFDKRFGNFTNRFGEIVEYMVAPNLLEKFREFGLNFLTASSNFILSKRSVPRYTEP